MREFGESQRHFHEVFDDVKEMHKKWISQNESESAQSLTGTMTNAATMTNMVSFGTTTTSDVDEEIYTLLTRSQYNLARSLHANHDLAKAEKHYLVALRNRTQIM